MTDGRTNGRTDQRMDGPTTRLLELLKAAKKDYVMVIKNFLNPKGHQNPISGSKVRDILLKGWILPIGGASAGKGLRRLFFPCIYFILSTGVFVVVKCVCRLCMIVN